MKKQINQRDYLANSRNMQLKIDEFFAEKVIPANDSVRLLDKIVEEMNTNIIFRAYKRTGRKPATNPITLLKILLYANMEGIYSSRAIESSCKRDINFIWILNGAKAPNHYEIARFRSQRLSECAEELFYELVLKLQENKEIKFEHLFVDGTKIEANANKYSFVWKKSTTKYETCLLEKLTTLCEKISNRYEIMPCSEEELLALLESRNTQSFVHGRGKRKSQIQKDIEILRELLARKIKYSKYQDTFKGRNSFSKTDTDATFMHMKDDHMRNEQLKPGYNVQIGVEGEYITGVSVGSERSDQLTLIEFLENMEKHTGKYYEGVTADAGYESEENYTWFEDKPCNAT